MKWLLDAFAWLVAVGGAVRLVVDTGRGIQAAQEAATFEEWKQVYDYWDPVAVLALTLLVFIGFKLAAIVAGHISLRHSLAVAAPAHGIRETSVDAQVPLHASHQAARSPSPALL